MTSSVPAGRVAHWLRCAEKTCCSYYLVYVTGDDVARIARTLGVAPWMFTVAIPSDAAEAGSFALDRSGSRNRLALVRTQVTPEDVPFCTFLVRVPDGAARCGLGAGRPAPCRSFPAQLLDGAVRSEHAGCTCDWSAVTQDDEADATLLRAERDARETYMHVVAAWNDFVAQQNEEARLTHRDFCRYLLDAYPA